MKRKFALRMLKEMDSIYTDSMGEAPNMGLVHEMTPEGQIEYCVAMARNIAENLKNYRVGLDTRGKIIGDMCERLDWEQARHKEDTNTLIMLNDRIASFITHQSSFEVAVNLLFGMPIDTLDDQNVFRWRGSLIEALAELLLNRPNADKIEAIKLLRHEIHCDIVDGKRLVDWLMNDHLFLENWTRKPDQENGEEPAEE